MMKGVRILTVLLFLALSHVSQAASEPPTTDYSCNTCGDCEIKDVGNCCGYYPECVNVNFQPDPEAVSQWCKDNEMGGVCGFPSIDTCACVAGRCQGKLSTEEGVEMCTEEPTEVDGDVSSDPSAATSSKQMATLTMMGGLGVALVAI